MMPLEVIMNVLYYALIIWVLIGIVQIILGVGGAIAGLVNRRKRRSTKVIEMQRYRNRN